MNKCPMVAREGGAMDFLGNDCDQLLEASRRCINFDAQVDDMEELEALTSESVMQDVG